MSSDQKIEVDIRSWEDDDLSLQERLLGDPAMAAYIGGPETPEKIRERHERYLRGVFKGQMFVIVVGKERVAAGSVGYWEKEWRGQQVWETGWFVLPEFQGKGIASQATAIVIQRARAAREHQFMHAFPSVDNKPSNSICRKLGFTLIEAVEFEYPPGHFMLCNDWRLDLFANSPESVSA